MNRFITFSKNLFALLKPYWTSEEKWLAGLLLAGALACEAIQVRVVVIFNSWLKVFYDALQFFDIRDVLLALLEFLIILAIAIIIFSFGNYFSGLLSNRWRRWMTKRYVTNWLDNNVMYALQILNKNIDNPDQRISEDLNEFPTFTLSLCTGFFNAILTFISFSVILWNLSGSLSFSFRHHQYTIPGYMFWATFIYAGIGTWLIFVIGKKLPNLNYLQEQFNANFRFNLIRVRESAEQIALYRGGKDEQQRLMGTFNYIFQNFINIIHLQRSLSFFLNGYNLASQIAGTLVALPRYIKEHLALGMVIQISYAFQQVVSALSFVVNSFVTIANWRAAIRRLTEFTHHMEESAAEIAKKNIQITPALASKITVKDLDLTLPQGDILVDKLNLTVNAGEKILITGTYGSGKSTLLRAVADVWPYGMGKLDIPENAKMLFLPQRPYFPIGTLKQALLYPASNIEISEDKLKETLEEVGLPHLKDRLNELRFWQTELSFGEQQLVGFARIFFYEPEWIFLDEATSALDEATEKTIYLLLYKKLPKATVVSVGHRSTLKEFHDRIIVIPKIRAGLGLHSLTPNGSII